MRIPKRWISLCLVILLLAGVVFGHGSLMADQAEAAEPETMETASVITEEGAGVPAVQSEINQPQTTPESQPQTTPESQPQTGTSVTGYIRSRRIGERICTGTNQCSGK